MGLLSALLATNQPAAVSNVIQQQTGIAVAIPGQKDPETVELENIMRDDDDAMAEVNGWISTNAIPLTNQIARLAFQQRIRERLKVVQDEYTGYLRNHPESARGYLAYGSFLNDIGDETAAEAQYENSRQLDPKNPAVWNNLANYYGEYGDVTNAFADYEEAIRLDPTEPVYFQNFATTVYLYRKDAKAYYHIDEQQTFDKALGLYRQAMKLEPENLVLATDYAESYYGIRPLRTNDALMAWSNALVIARDDNEREGVRLHLARVNIAAGFYREATRQLDLVTNTAYASMRRELRRSLVEHQKNSKTANNPDGRTSTGPNPAPSVASPPASP